MKNQAKLQKYLFIMLFVSLNSMLMAQFSQQQADSLVLNDIIAGDTLNVDLFSLNNQRNVQDSIVLFNGDKIACPFTNNWVYFIDDNPAANWFHPCRYIFVDTQTGEDSTISRKIYPVDWETNYDTLNQAFQSLSGTAMSVGSTATISGGLAPNPNLYAVILCGFDQQRYWYDISGIYNTLIGVYGYTKENIFVLYEDGTSGGFGDDLDGGEYSDDIDYSANYNDVDRLFRNLSGELNDPDIPELQAGSQLFLFVNGHGFGDGQGNSYAMMNNFDLNDYDLAGYLENIKCSQMIIMLENCFSGGFVDDLSDYSNYNVQCKNRSIHTAASINGASYAEFYMSWENNPSLFFADEFVWYWNAAARGYFPVYNQPWLNTSDPIESYPFNNITTWENHPPAYDPDVNGDGFVQMQEAFDYTNNFDTWSQYGYFQPYTLGEESPQAWSDISFQEDLLSLCGLVGDITHTQTPEVRNYFIGGNLKVKSGKTLTINNGSNLFLGNEISSLKIENNSNIILQDNVSIHGLNFNSRFFVDGSLTVGNNVSFKSGGLTNWNIILHNPNMQTVFDNTTFNNSELTNYGQNLTITNSTFTSQGNLMMYSYNGSVSISNSSFQQTWVYLENINLDPSFSISVSNCNFQAAGSTVAVDVYSYDNFNILNNTMNNYFNGIQIHNSGEGPSGNQNIFGNEFYNNTWSGISIWNSTASISSNHVHDNKYGIRLYNNSNIALYGNPGATNYDDVNYITNNISYEVFASSASFPWSFHYNAIIDEDNAGNPTDPMVYYEPPTGGTPLMDVKHNCWGNNFNASQDLYPSGYMVNPTWCPGNGGGGNKSTEVVRQLYENGRTDFENGNYSEAKTSFDSIINSYPNTIYASSAMRELFSLEKYLTNDYTALKQFYQTNDSIQADSILMKLSDFLANKCEVKMENWQVAIDHYESIINNPETPEDSIFAIIDLGNTYLLMANDSTSRETVKGKLLQYIPESAEQYHNNVNYLSALLPIQKTRQDKKQNPELIDKIGILQQNTPNPFKETTRIDYSLQDKSEVIIEIYDFSGRLLKSILLGEQPAGTNQTTLKLNDLKNGVYFYSLKVNGQLTDTKKMVLMN